MIFFVSRQTEGLISEGRGRVTNGSLRAVAEFYTLLENKLLIRKSSRFVQQGPVGSANFGPVKIESTESFTLRVFEIYIVEAER